MDDLEINRRCAKKSGWHTGRKASEVVAFKVTKSAIIAGNDAGGESVYDPLHDDAQAMALVKRFHITTLPTAMGWTAVCAFTGSREHQDLNHAICECVAKLPD